MSATEWFEKGCNCQTSCKGGMEIGDECMYFIARTRGPISFLKCKCVNDGGKTYHDRNGMCLHCEYEAKRKGIANEQHLPANHLVGVYKQP